MPKFHKTFQAFAILTAVLAVYDLPNATADTAFLNDRFSGSSVNPDLWYIPTYTSSIDGTFVGRTQFRATQDSSLPAVSDGNACIPVETYNPKGLSFYGTEIITKREFTPETGLDVVVRARMKTSNYHGIVGGIFLYSLRPGSVTLHDEIDFELLTNVPDKVQTNLYAHEPLGTGHVELIPFRHGTVADWHDYEIKWTAKEVSWIVDDHLIRTTATNIPTNGMNFYANIWAPDPGWPQGFSATIQPAAGKAQNETLNALCIDSIVIKPLAP